MKGLFFWNDELFLFGYMIGYLYVKLIWFDIIIMI